MRWLLGTGLILLVAQGAVRADPDAPQVSPLPGRREDTQRLRDQLRGLDRVPVPAAVTVPPASSATTVPAAASTEPRAGSSSRQVAVALLSVAAATGLATLALVVAASPGDSGTAYDTAETALGVTAAVTATLGLITLVRTPSATVAPTVTSRSIGLAIRGRL